MILNTFIIMTERSFQKPAPTPAFHGLGCPPQASTVTVTPFLLMLVKKTKKGVLRTMIH